MHVVSLESTFLLPAYFFVPQHPGTIEQKSLNYSTIIRSFEQIILSSSILEGDYFFHPPTIRDFDGGVVDMLNYNIGLVCGCQYLCAIFELGQNSSISIVNDDCLIISDENLIFCLRISFFSAFKRFVHSFQPIPSYFPKSFVISGDPGVICV